MEVVVAAISAAIALAALVVSILVARRQTAIQERLAAIEEARHAEEVAARGRAWVRASLELDRERELVVVDNEVMRGNPLMLVLLNEGPAIAHSVRAEVQEGPEFNAFDLQPGQRRSFEVTKGPGIRQVTVHWTDEAGDHSEPYTLQID